MEKEREEAKKRMMKAMKNASEEANREDRLWSGPSIFLPQWEEAIQLIDNLWLAGANSRWDDLRGAEGKLRFLPLKSKKRPGKGHRKREDFLEKFRKRIFHETWRPQHNNEIQIMQETIERIRHVPPANSTRDFELDAIYQYPYPENGATSMFVQLAESSSKGKACSAVVYDAEGCSDEVVNEVVAKRTTRSVINVNPQILASIPPNNNLLFLGCRDGKGDEPSFVQQNRDRWWDQQTTNSSIFYFTPLGISDNYSCHSYNSKIAHILVLITAPSLVLIRVIHRGGDPSGSNVSIREDGNNLGIIFDISSKMKLDSFPAFVLQSGRHELELICHGFYALRDILIEFPDDAYIVDT